jgi:hypothetical protein
VVRKGDRDKISKIYFCEALDAVERAVLKILERSEEAENLKKGERYRELRSLIQIYRNDRPF